MSQEFKPYIPASKKLAETTVKAIILGFILSAVLAAANAYLGLKIGMTVSASIPAAVISMGVLKLFRKSNILENNIVQTAASAGESLAAGVIFTFPALILMGYWSEFEFWQTVLIALCGGVLGVFFTIPLRSALIVKEKLQFPEGVATSEVLKTGEKGGKNLKYLVWGGIAGAIAIFAEKALQLWSSKLELAALIKGKFYAFFGLGLSPALVAVGYIVGLRIAALVFIGGAISWFVAIPIYMAINGVPDAESLTKAGGIVWNNQIRYLGVGAMVVGGVWALLSLIPALKSALGQALSAFKKVEANPIAKLRTEYDTPMSWVVIGIGVLIVPIFIIYLRVIGNVPISLFMAIFMVIAGFLFSAVAGYMAGLVGSSNNPISGVTIATILTSSLILLALLGTGAEKGPIAAIMIGAVVCCAAAIAGDNMQDLKAGHILGATPFRQQIMQMIGVVAAAFVLPLVLNLLHKSEGIGSEGLSAPQASLMQSVADGVFKQNLPWGMIAAGAGIGALVIIADQIQKSRGSKFRLPVLAVAVGLYLPFYLDSGIFLGGLIAWAVTKFQSRKLSGKNKGEEFESAKKRSDQTGLLFASGLITGEALIGIGIAALVVALGDEKNIYIFDKPMPWPGLIAIGIICFLLYRFAKKAFLSK